jgi:hypothetical protein
MHEPNTKNRPCTGEATTRGSVTQCAENGTGGTPSGVHVAPLSADQLQRIRFGSPVRKSE